MTVAIQSAPPKKMTYEDYLAEGEINQRYDIIDGVRMLYMASPTLPHQVIVIHILESLREYQKQTRRGMAIIAPLDILVSRLPLRTRQPDVFFISRERLDSEGGSHPEVPLTVAPELVVEVLSGSDTRRTRTDKIADFCSIGGNECWLVAPEGETVEVLRLTPEGAVRAAIYGAGETAQSLTFPDLTLALDDIFRLEE
jgi:Uma2 family endonuclease